MQKITRGLLSLLLTFPAASFGMSESPKNVAAELLRELSFSGSSNATAYALIDKVQKQAQIKHLAVKDIIEELIQQINAKIEPSQRHPGYSLGAKYLGAAVILAALGYGLYRYTAYEKATIIEELHRAGVTDINLSNNGFVKISAFIRGNWVDNQKIDSLLDKLCNVESSSYLWFPTELMAATTGFIGFSFLYDAFNAEISIQEYRNQLKKNLEQYLTTI